MSNPNDRDRDHYRPKTPAPGTIKTLVPGKPEDWDGPTTDVHDKPAPGVPEAPLARIGRLAGESMNTTTQIMKDLRDVNKRIDGLASKQEATDGKVEGMIVSVGELKDDLGVAFKQNDEKNDQIVGLLIGQNERYAAQNDQLIGSHLQARERSGMLRLKTTEAELEVGVAQQLADNEIIKANKLVDAEIRKKKWLTIWAIVGTALGTGGILGVIVHSCT